MSGKWFLVLCCLLVSHSFLNLLPYQLSGISLGKVMMTLLLMKLINSPYLI